MDKKDQRRLATIEDYKSTFSSKSGEKVLWDLMREHHMISPTMDVNTHDTAFREGQRNVVLRILQLMKTDTKKLLKIIEQAEENRRNMEENE